MIDILSIWLIVWLIKNAAVDVSCAIKGTENPRYALKRQKALAAGKAAPRQPRYGSRDWLGDLVSDGLVAQTERRRAKATEKAKAAVEAAEREERPLDDLAEAVREEPQRPAPARVDTDEFPEFESSVAHDDDPVQGFMDRIEARNGGTGRPECEHCGRRVNVGYLYPRAIDGRNKKVCAHCAGLMEFDAALVVPVPAGQPLDKDGLYFELSPGGKTARSVPLPQKEGGRYYRLSFGDEVTAKLGGRRRCSRCQEAPSQDQDRPLCAGCQLELDALYAAATAAVAEHDPDGTLKPGATARVKDAVKVNDRYGWLPQDVADFVHLAQLEVVDRKATPTPTDDRPDAVIIPFPNPKSTVKEISMATSEVNGLTTALAFAQAAADAHNSFATGGSEGYTGALAGWEVGDRCVGLAREAQEASQIAAAKWAAHVESLEEQLKVKEAYQGAPDAGNKTFLLNG